MNNVTAISSEDSNSKDNLVSEWIKKIETQSRKEEEEQLAPTNEVPEVSLEGLTPEERAKITEVMRRDSVLKLYTDLKVR